MLASEGGEMAKGLNLGRQVGNKYGWLARSCAAVLHNRDKFLVAVAHKELCIPGSDDIILSDDTNSPSGCGAHLLFSI